MALNFPEAPDPDSVSHDVLTHFHDFRFPGCPHTFRFPMMLRHIFVSHDVLTHFRFPQCLQCKHTCFGIYLQLRVFIKGMHASEHG